jgi:hypothetical protein
LLCKTSQWYCWISLQSCSTVVEFFLTALVFWGSLTI